jgi:alginate O-acetyltransferase complex protein AlgI
MNFSTIPFALVFLPLFLLAYLLIKPSFRFMVILTGSVLFVAAGQITALPWLLGLTFIGYILGRRIDGRLGSGKNASFLMWTGIGMYGGILLAVKWIVTYKMNSLGGFHLSTFVLPLGISYFTFQIISYLVDVSLGIIPAEKNILRLIFHVLFFPKLAAGPIMKYQQLSGQTASLDPSEKDVISGLVRVLTGEMKCIFIADRLSLFVHPAFNGLHADLEPSLAWLALIASVLQIYYDFSGYTDIGIGLGRMMGVKLPENFNYPFQSQSISEFWRRWHMTLMGWFREYVFFPLERRRFKFAGQQINLLVVFFITGLWHGPTLNYLFWGILQGLAMIIESISPCKQWLNAAWRPVRQLYFIFFFLISWVFFRSPNMTFAFEFIGRLAGKNAGLVPSDQSFQSTGHVVGWSLPLVMLLGMIFSLPVVNVLKTWLENSPGVHRLVLSLSRNSGIGMLTGTAFFIWKRKRWWLVPMALVFAAFGFLFSLTATWTASPFVYTLF